MKISFPGYEKAETLTNFPALVVLSNGMAGTTFDFGTFLTTNGYDLRFWNDAETTNLNYEIERWSTGSSSYVWVQVPQFYSNCYIWATWADSTKTNQPTTCTNGDVWSEGYSGVWHYPDGTTLSCSDSSGTGSPGTRNGTPLPSAGAGQIDGAAVLNGSSGYISNPYVAARNLNGPFTVNFWFKAVTYPGSWPGIMGTTGWKTAIGGGWGFWYSTADTSLHIIKQNNQLQVGATTSTTKYNHFSVVYDGVNLVRYKDGVQTASSAASFTTDNNTAVLKVGVSPDNNYGNFSIDELRLSTAARSSNWIWACWMNQGSNSFFNTPGTVQVSSGIIINNNSATNIVNNAADLVATLNATGAVYQAWAYWGTEDGTNNADGLWQNTNSVGWFTNQNLAITNPVSGLLSNTTYYYTFRAANDLTNFWASPSTNFITCGPPVVSNAAPANIGIGYATLQGYLATTGKVPTTVYTYWGTNDGVTVKSSWQNVYTNGVLPVGAFSNTVSNLTYGLTYFYRCYATNSYGDAWAPTTTNFITLPPAFDSGTVSNIYATNIYNTAADMIGTVNATGTAFQIWAYWGTVDGTNNGGGLWQNSAFLGWYTNVTVVLTNPVSNLSTNTYYYYTFMVTNALTNIWAPSSVNFLTAYAAYLPFTETFEDSPAYMANTLGTWPVQHGWRASPAAYAQVQSSVVYGGSKAGSTSNNILYHAFLGSPATNVWVDFYAIPQRRALAGTLPQNLCNSNSTTAFYVNDAGNVVVLSNTTWLAVATNYVIPTNTWVRFSINLNYASSNWSLYVAGSVSNAMATNLAQNLAFQGSATNTTFGMFRVNTILDQRKTYLDSISMADGATNNIPMAIDSDGDGLPDRWEVRYFGDLSHNGTADTDGDGFTDRQEYIAGTNPNNADSYPRIAGVDIASSNSPDISVTWLGGTDTVTTVYSGDQIGRRFLFTAANNNWTNQKVTAASLPDAMIVTNTWTDVNAASIYTSRYYYLSVSMGGSGYTNTTFDWAMYSQARPASKKFMISVPIDYGNTNDNNFGGLLGQQIARGLFANNNTNLCDRISYLTLSNTYKELFLATNLDASVYWWDPDSTTTANIPVTPGMAFWVYRGASNAVRTNTVFAGRSFASTSAVPLTIGTNRWTMFGWPLPRPRLHVNTEASGEFSTPTNQFGFEASANGGQTADLGTNDADTVSLRGDQIWVWKDNTWKSFYWLIGHFDDTNWDGRWWDENKSDFANFQLEPGQGYYYWHPTNMWGGTNFIFTPANAP